MTCMNGIIEKHTESFKAFLYEVAKDEESGKNIEKQEQYWIILWFSMKRENNSKTYSSSSFLSFFDPFSEDEPWETFKNITPTLLEKSDFLDEQKSFMVLHSLLAMFRGRLLEGLNERVMMNNAAGKIQDYDGKGEGGKIFYFILFYFIIFLFLFFYCQQYWITIIFIEEEELFQLLDELPEPDLKKKNSSQEPQTEVTFLTKTLKSGQLLKKKGKIQLLFYIYVTLFYSQNDSYLLINNLIITPT